MNPILKNILAIVAGLVAGSAVNMGIIMISGSIIAPRVKELMLQQMKA